MISGRLTMRAQVERNSATGKDSWGNPIAPVFAPIGAPIPCFIWSNGTREIVDGDKTAMIEDVRGLFALGADLAETDELASVTNRKGAVLIVGRLRVDAPVQHKHTHLEAVLRRIG
ncbi:hypothetical protein [Sphingobium lignivorans]|uniref:Uncharacterized protein n=1 Tax=Sphingobium lignivorans TaxID=2735886 RepID=A0ABR6NJH4_9SPHN|nr:hypothetical protein [Sphingobium lignivorans]MBB5987430.1 hypothetical protein [Sphingobium lignivorans]